MSRPMRRVRTTWALKCRRTRKEREIRLRILSTGFSLYYSTASLRAPLHRVYAFPPVSIVGQVLQLVYKQQASVLLITPKWPSQWWWPVLLERAVMDPVELSRVHVPRVHGPLFVQCRKNMVPHPLGEFEHKEAVTWVATLLGSG
jgi:hypothetical protein